MHYLFRDKRTNQVVYVEKQIDEKTYLVKNKQGVRYLTDKSNLTPLKFIGDNEKEVV